MGEADPGHGHDGEGGDDHGDGGRVERCEDRRVDADVVAAISDGDAGNGEHWARPALRRLDGRGLIIIVVEQLLRRRGRSG